MDGEQTGGWVTNSLYYCLSFVSKVLLASVRLASRGCLPLWRAWRYRHIMASSQLYDIFLKYGVYIQPGNTNWYRYAKPGPTSVLHKKTSSWISSEKTLTRPTARSLRFKRSVLWNSFDSVIHSPLTSISESTRSAQWKASPTWWLQRPQRASFVQVVLLDNPSSSPWLIGWIFSRPRSGVLVPVLLRAAHD